MTAHQFGQLARDRQPQARAAEGACVGVLGLGEALEQPWQHVRIDADAGVANRKPQPRGAHLDDTVKTSWHRRIDDVVRRYHAEQIDRETAFIELAAICRGIASAHTGRDLHAHTLTDIRREPRNPSTRTGLDTRRMTIAALYPPEYADSAVDTHAREVSVDDAAGWASTLVERWGR